MSEILKLSQIRIDGGTQSRASIAEQVVSDYAEAMRDGIAFPPPTVFHDGTDYWLADGFHRFHALSRNGEETAWMDVRQGTRRDAILFSVGANSSHGLPRTKEDKNRAVTVLVQDAEWSTWSDNEIRKRCAVSIDMVQRIRREHTFRSESMPVPPAPKIPEHVQAKADEIKAAGGNPRFFTHGRTGKTSVMDVSGFKKNAEQPSTNDEAPCAPIPPGEFDPFAIHSNRESVRDGLPDSIKQIEATKEAARSSRKLDADELLARVEELEESQRVLEADYASVLAENKSFEAMRVQFEKGGFAEVVAGKDEEISVLKTRLYSESQTAAEWRRKCNFWKDQAKKLGWRNERFEGQTEALPDDDAFYDVVNGG